MIGDDFDNNALDAQVVRLDTRKAVGGGRFTLIPFDKLKPSPDPAYLIKGIFPRTGLAVVWGPPKCGKSFWVTDAMLHVALGWVYRGHDALHGPVVYCALEGQAGYGNRAEAFRQHHLAEDATPVPFYLVATRMSLVRDHNALIADIKAQLGPGTPPMAVVIDTLNRSLDGSENDDKDMTAYIRAADAIREAFGCVVIIVHHCGVEGTRPRGHTSLTGAVDAQIAVKRDPASNIVAEIEWLKDGREGEIISSKLESVEVGTDANGEPITSCVVVPADIAMKAGEPKLSPNQQTMFMLLHTAGAAGLTTDEWNERARETGLGIKRKADLYDFREALKSKGRVRQYGNRWTVAL
jgi:AAA domain